MQDQTLSRKKFSFFAYNIWMLCNLLDVIVQHLRLIVTACFTQMVLGL